jgi:hypothetical protein
VLVRPEIQVRPANVACLMGSVISTVNIVTAKAIKAPMLIPPRNATFNELPRDAMRCNSDSVTECMRTLLREYSTVSGIDPAGTILLSPDAIELRLPPCRIECCRKAKRSGDFQHIATVQLHVAADTTYESCAGEPHTEIHLIRSQSESQSHDEFWR